MATDSEGFSDTTERISKNCDDRWDVQPLLVETMIGQKIGEMLLKKATKYVQERDSYKQVGLDQAWNINM